MEKYGAGIETLSKGSGVSADLIEKALKARKEKYKKSYQFDEQVLKEIQASRITTKIRTAAGFTAGYGFYHSVTGTVYGFMECDAPEWQQNQGDMTCFPIPITKNYPSQGLGGEIMQVQIGRLYRLLLVLDLLDNIVLINTIHDSVYLDININYLHYLPYIAGLLEDVSPYFNKILGTDWDTPFRVSCEYGKNMLELTETVTARNNLWVNIGHNS